MLRNDTTILLKPAHYARFVRPFDQRLLGEFGGCIHFCGQASHLHELLVATGGLSGVNSSQPELNDHRRLFELAQARRVVLLRWPRAMLPPGVRTGVVVSGRQ